MNQSKIDSVMEVVTNTAVGFLVAMLGNNLFLPLVFGIQVSMVESAITACLFTVLSMVRQYAIRRAFNGRSVWQAMRSGWQSIFG